MQKKLFGAFLLILLLGILLAGFLYAGLIRSSYMSQLEERLISNGVLIEQSFLERQPYLSSEALQNEAEKFGDRINTRITLIDEAGNVLADTGSTGGNLENHLYRPEIQEALNGRIGTASRYSSTIQTELFYVALPVDASLPFRVIRLAVSLQEVQDINRRLYGYITVSVLIGLFASMMLAYRFIRQMMQPIQEMTVASQTIAGGQFDRRVRVFADDELGELANNFNHMAMKLKEMVGMLSENNTKFKALLTSIRNPIIAVDNKHQIILLNPAAEQLFGIRLEDIIGKHILEVIRNNVLDEHIKNILTGQLHTQVEIHVHDPEERILKIYSNPIIQEEDPTRVMGIVTLIEDVTAIRKLEKIRSDFVANVSHELKTPLTSISGFVETLRTGGIEDEQTSLRFLEIIDIEAGRLTRLIDDILTLSEIENIHPRGEKQVIRTLAAIHEVEMMLGPLAQNKGVELVVETPDHLPNLAGSHDLFKQMLINVVDNGIKYTPKGGRVTLCLEQERDVIHITVSDTGIGIPKADIPRLCERFYRVDKARSRKVGGTGLGLAIVKHILIALQGEMKIESTLGKGSVFHLLIPYEK